MLSFHELAFQTLFAQLEDTAQSQAVIPLESPGLKIERTVKAIDYVYWRRTRTGRREEELIGRADAPTTSPTTAAKLADLGIDPDRAESADVSITSARQSWIRSCR